MSFQLTDEERKNHSLVLAYERTLLARDRTIMAVIRTALSFILIGVGFIGFHGHVWWFNIVGWVCVVIGAGTLIGGVIYMMRYHLRLSRFAHLKKHDPSEKLRNGNKGKK